MRSGNTTRMSRLVVLIATVVGSLLTTLSAAAPDRRAEDLQTLLSQLEKRHKNVYNFTARPALEAQAAQVRAVLDQTPPEVFRFQLLTITALVGDAHTYVHAPVDERRLPILLYWFQNDLRVVRVLPGYEKCLGAKVVSIEGTPAADVDRKIRKLLSQNENEWFYKANSAGLLTVPAALYVAGLTKRLDVVEVAFEGEGGDTFSLSLPAAPIEAARASWKAYLEKDTPLHAQKPGDGFWWQTLDDNKTLYICFRDYRQMNALTRPLADAIRKQKPARLVVDLRGNRGGDFNVGRGLIRRLKELGCEGGERVYVITGRATFSAAMVNAIDFKKELRATIVGEPAGERPNGYQENEEFTLPNSKLVVSYSTRLYRFLETETDAFQPDHFVEPVWNVFRQGRDAALEWILQQPAP